MMPASAENTAPSSAGGNAPTAPVMTLERVVFGYEPQERVIDDFSAQLQPGMLCGLIGPNAAGKSTLLRLMLGQLTPQSGIVRLQNRPVHELTSPQLAARVSYVPQRGGVSFAFTVEQVVSMGRFALPRDSAAVDRAIEQCDLNSHRRRIYRELSVGQQQRVLLARALAQSDGRGAVLLLDEPGSAMDLRHLHSMMALLRHQCEQGLAILVVMHDLNLAARYADQLWLMDEGRMVAHGHWQQVLAPEVLEPVYRVSLRAMTPEVGGRPVFFVPEADTLS